MCVQLCTSWEVSPCQVKSASRVLGTSASPFNANALMAGLSRALLIRMGTASAPLTRSAIATVALCSFHVQHVPYLTARWVKGSMTTAVMVMDEP